jgi:putative aldouronate transport system permease protein
MKKSIGSHGTDVVNHALLAVVALVTFFPFYYVLIVSFTSPTEYLSRSFVLWPERWSLASYRYLVRSQSFVRSVGVSGFLAVVGTVLSLLANTAFAFALSRRGLPKKFLMVIVVFTMLFHPGMIPNFLVVKAFGLVNTLWALIVPTLTSAWTLILMKTFFESIPDSLDDAAFIDGCSEVGIWLRIALPLALPMLAAFGLFAAVGYWNTYFSAILYLNDYKLYPLQVFLRNMLVDPAQASGGAFSNRLTEEDLPEETLKMAAVVLSTVPILIVYPFLQKHFTKGLMLGSVKG